MLRREKKQSEKEETSRKKPQPKLPFADKSGDDDSIQCNKPETSSPKWKKVIFTDSDDDSNRIKSSTSPFKGQIDLNIRPEREEELSPGSDPGNMVKLIQDATDVYLKQQRLCSSPSNNNKPATNPATLNGGSAEQINNSVILDTSHQDSNEMPASAASVSATG